MKKFIFSVIAFILIAALAVVGVKIYLEAPVKALRENLDNAGLVRVKVDFFRSAGLNEETLEPEGEILAGRAEGRVSKGKADFAIYNSRAQKLSHCYADKYDLKWDLRPAVDMISNDYGLPDELAEKVLSFFGVSEIIIGDDQAKFLIDAFKLKEKDFLIELPSPANYIKQIKRGFESELKRCSAAIDPEDGLKIEGYRFYKSKTDESFRIGIKDMPAETGSICIVLDRPGEYTRMYIDFTLSEKSVDIPIPGNIIPDKAFNVIKNIWNWLNDNPDIIQQALLFIGAG